MNTSITYKLIIALGMLTASSCSNASLLTHSFSYDEHSFSFSLSDQNVFYDAQGFFVSTDLVGPEEVFTFESEDLGLNIATSDINDFDVFEVYFDEVLSNGIFSFVTEFTVNDLLITLAYDVELDFFDFIIEDLVTGDFLIDVIDLASGLQSDSIVVDDDAAIDVSEPPLYFLLLMAVCFLLMIKRSAFTHTTLTHSKS